MLLDSRVVFLNGRRISLRLIDQVQIVDCVVVDISKDLIGNVQIIEESGPLEYRLRLLAGRWAILESRITSKIDFSESVKF